MGNSTKRSIKADSIRGVFSPRNYFGRSSDLEGGIGDWLAYSDVQTVAAGSNPVNTGTEVITVSTHGFVNDDPIYYTSSNTAIGGLTSTTTYYVISATTNTFQLASTVGGVAIDLTSQGVGNHSFAPLRPVNGTGGSPTITATTTSLSQLRNFSELAYTKDANVRVGEGIACQIDIDPADAGKIINLNFDYVVSSGTFTPGDTSTDSDIMIWAYDISGAVRIPCTPAKLTSSSTAIAGLFSASFQSSPTTYSYRIMLHCRSTAASAFTLKFDGFNAGPAPRPVYGPPVTDWVSITPTGSWNTNVTYTGRVRRIGDSVEFEGLITLSGAPNSVSATINYPAGYLPDTTKLVSTAVAGNVRIGYATVYDSSAGERFDTNVFHAATSGFAFQTIARAAASTNNMVTVDQANPVTFASSDTIHFKVFYPVLGWSSNVQMSNDSDTRTVAAVLSGSSTTVTSSEVTIGATTVVKDTHGAWSSDTYTVPVSGFYSIKAYLAGASVAYTAGNSFYIGFRKNGGSTIIIGAKKIDANLTSSQFASGSLDYYFNVGDTIQFRGFSSTSENSADFNASITRVSGASVIAASELVAARYTNSAGTTLTKSTTNTMVYATKDYDTHGVWVSNTFTAPVSGKYRVTASYLLVSGLTWATGDFNELDIYKNGALHTGGIPVIFFGTSGSSTGATVSGTINCVAGDTITLVATPSKASATNPTLNTSGAYNFVMIERIGF